MKTCGTCHGLIPGFCQCEHRDRWTKVLGEWVIGAPQWLKDRMAKLRAMPPPTLEEVRTMWAASAKWQDEYGFECVERIKKAKYIR